ncbi:glycosyltransferase [Methylovorus menthalis]|uniref:glycosyltransferase n=1 Tax=Methylovorus menthalis TaxID=1002227 RepID=UPI001E36F992|nr:glycosyltransferase [Methylovorus menthalis]MCB4810634.1 glycosyltransferase [Methylovorus menthalis]
MNTQLPLVSICIPTFNSEKTIRETLLSILNQSYKNLRIHVVDNASEDSTVSIAESVADERVLIHRNTINVGGEGNFNRCIQIASGKYTAIFHADDVYEPDIVETEVSFLEAHPEVGATFTEARLIDENGDPIGAIKFPAEMVSAGNVHDFPALMKAILRHSNFLICPSVMARTSIYKDEIKQWRGDLFRSSADLDVWLRIAKTHKVGFIPAPLLRYRISSHQFSARIRLQTERPDFFLVADHYIAEPPVRRVLNEQDIENYDRLDRRDRVMRAVNCIITGNMHKAPALLNDIFSWSTIKASIQTKRGLGVMCAAIYLKLLLILKMENFGQRSLQYLKHLMHK